MSGRRDGGGPVLRQRRDPVRSSFAIPLSGDSIGDAFCNLFAASLKNAYNQAEDVTEG